MAAVTTSTAYSHQFYKSLILQPLYFKSVVLRTIFRVETNATTAYLPRVTGGSVGWVQEAAEIADSGAAVDLVPVTARKLAALATVSNEAVGDANADQMLGQALADAVAAQVDYAFFRGGGSFGPAGLPGVAGVEAIDANPASGLDPWTDAIAAIEGNGGQATVGYLSPTTWASLAKLKEATGSARPVLSDPTIGPTGATQRMLGGLQLEVTNACPDGEAWVLDGTRVGAVVRLDGEVKSDESAKFTADSTVVRVITRVGFGSPYPRVIAKIKDVA